MNKRIEEIIKQAFDIHYHIGPEIIPRKYTVADFIKAESGKIGGAVLKNHFYATSVFINRIKQNKKLKLFGSIVLNNAVGGLNAKAIYAASIISDQPIMVWFPTINAENFLRQSAFEIAPEWVKQKGFVAKKSKDVKPVITTKNGKLTKQALEVLRMIKKCNAVLATGHISWKESNLLAQKARKMGIQVIITHPIYQRIGMPIKIQKELARKGCFIEQSYSMYSIDKIPIQKIAEQIKSVGYRNVILSSDVGQKFSPPPSQALYQFSTLLQKERIDIKNLYQMLVINPKKLMKID